LERVYRSCAWEGQEKFRGSDRSEDVAEITSVLRRKAAPKTPTVPCFKLTGFGRTRREVSRNMTHMVPWRSGSIGTERLVIDQGNSDLWRRRAEIVSAAQHRSCGCCWCRTTSSQNADRVGAESLVPGLVTGPFRLSTPRTDAGGIRAPTPWLGWHHPSCVFTALVRCA
jgi:hypothetical protein